MTNTLTLSLVVIMVGWQGPGWTTQSSARKVAAVASSESRALFICIIVAIPVNLILNISRSARALCHIQASVTHHRRHNHPR